MLESKSYKTLFVRVKTIKLILLLPWLSLRALRDIGLKGFCFYRIFILIRRHPVDFV